MFGTLISLFLVITALPQSQATSQICIGSENKTIEYGMNVFLSCNMNSNYQWWQSNDDCETFSEYPVCNSKQECEISANKSLGTYYHFCCTASVLAELTDLSQVSKCFYISVCIDVTETTFPAVAFFGKQATVFVQLHAEPPPMNFNLQVIYADSLPSDHAVLNVSGVDYAVSLDDPALLTYVYTFEVPEVNNVSAVESAELEFSVVLMHLNDLCGSFFVSKSRIPVTEAPEVVMVPSTTSNDACPTPVPTAVNVIQDMESSESCSTVAFVIPLVFLAVLFVAMCIVLVMVILLFRRKLRGVEQQRSYSPPPVYSTLDQSGVNHAAATTDGYPTGSSSPPPSTPPPLPQTSRPQQLRVNRQDSRRPLLTTGGSAANTPLTPVTSPYVSGTATNHSTDNYAHIPTVHELPEQATTPMSTV